MINGIQFSVFEAHDAAAGNRYDVTNYRTVSGGICYELQEFIHYGNIQNYEPGSIKEFDEPVVHAALDEIVHTFKITTH